MLYPLPSMPDTAFFGVYDGHSGKMAAQFCQEQMHLFLMKYAGADLPPEGIVEAFMRCDDEFLGMAVPREMRDGTTATVVTVTPTRMMCANVGDSRCVVSRAGEAIAMSVDHKASEPGEQERLDNLGARVRGKYIRAWNSTSMIAVSRAIGDKEYKKEKNPVERLLISVPHISFLDVTPDLQFCVIASDGLWDVVDNQTAVSFVLTELRAGSSAPQIARKLVIKALNRMSSDNITVLVVVFPRAVFKFNEYKYTINKGVASSGDSVDSWSTSTSTSSTEPTSSADADYSREAYSSDSS